MEIAGIQLLIDDTMGIYGNSLSVYIYIYPTSLTPFKRKVVNVTTFSGVWDMGPPTVSFGPVKRHVFSFSSLIRVNLCFWTIAETPPG